MARSAMGSDVFILFIIISMKESVSYSASFLTTSLLISFSLHDAQEFSQMRKLRIGGCQARRWMGWLPFVGQAIESVTGKEADILCEDLASSQI